MSFQERLVDFFLLSSHLDEIYRYHRSRASLHGVALARMDATCIWRRDTQEFAAAGHDRSDNYCPAIEEIWDWCEK